MADEAKVKFTADVSQPTSEIEKFTEKVKKSGEGFETIKKGVKSTREEIEQMGRGWVRSALGITAVVAGIKNAIQATLDLRKAQSDAGKTRGAAALERGRAGAQLGLSDQQIEAVRVMQVSGAAGEQSGASFVGSLADQGASDRSFKQRMTPAKILEAVRAQASGVFSESEIIEAIKKGKSLDVQARMSQVGGTARDELAIRARENLGERNRALMSDPLGSSQRLSEAESLRLRSQGGAANAAVNFLEGAPAIGTPIKAITEATIGARANAQPVQVTNFPRPPPQTNSQSEGSK